MSDDDDDDDDGDYDDKDDDGNDDNDDDDGGVMVRLILLIINVPSTGKVLPGCTLSQQGNIHLTTAVSRCHYPLLFTDTSD